MKQKTFSLLACVIICALLLPVRVIGRLQHPDTEANWLKTWMLSDTTYLGFRPLLFATIARFPYSKHFHELSALADKFHTRTFDNII